MANEAKRPGWWQDFRSLDEQTATFLGLESAATAIKMLEGRVIPGMLQTEAYTQILLEGIMVPAASEEVITESTAVRQKRRERFRSGDVSLTVVVDETAVIRDFGRPDIMSEQLDQLIADAELPMIELRLILFDAGPYPGIEGSFQHLTFGDRTLSDLVYVEGLLGKFLVDRESDVERYLTAFEQSIEKALSPQDSLTWLKKRRTELRSDRRISPRKAPPRRSKT
jgi:hypothetical protein